MTAEVHLNLHIHLPVPIFTKKSNWLEARAYDKGRELIKELRDKKHPDAFYYVNTFTDTSKFFVRLNGKRVPEIEKAISDYVYDFKANIEFERAHPEDQ